MADFFTSRKEQKMKFVVHSIGVFLVSALVASTAVLAQSVPTQQQIDRERANIERYMKEVSGGNASVSAPADVVFVSLELTPTERGPHVVKEAYKDGNFFIKAIGYHPTTPRQTLPGVTSPWRSVVKFNVYSHEVRDVRVDFDVYLKCADGSYVVRKDRDARLGGEKFDEAKFRMGAFIGFNSMGCKPDVKAQAIGFTNVKLKPLK